MPLYLNGRCMILFWKGSYVQWTKVRSTDSQSPFSVSKNTGSWNTEARTIIHFLVVQEDDSERCTRTRTAQVSFQLFQVSYLTTASPTVFYLFPHCTCYRVFTNCVLLFFLWSLFRSRSYPVPHRGERVKQRTVHPRNFGLFTLKDGFMLFINPGGYRGADKSLARPTSRCILFDV
jgi:hypothetical protein